MPLFKALQEKNLNFSSSTNSIGRSYLISSYEDDETNFQAHVFEVKIHVIQKIIARNLIKWNDMLVTETLWAFWAALLIKRAQLEFEKEFSLSKKSIKNRTIRANLIEAKFKSRAEEVN